MHILSFPAFSAGGQGCRLPRRYGGIHFQPGDYAGRGLGRQVAQFVWGTAHNPAPIKRADAVIVALRGRRHHA